MEQRRAETNDVYLETSVQSNMMCMWQCKLVSIPPSWLVCLCPPLLSSLSHQVMKVLEEILITTHREVILQECPKLIAENDVKSECYTIDWGRESSWYSTRDTVMGHGLVYTIDTSWEGLTHLQCHMHIMLLCTQCFYTSIHHYCHRAQSNVPSNGEGP